MFIGVQLHFHQKSGVWRILQTLNTLLAHVVGAGKTFPHRQLLTEVWGPNAVEQTQYLRVHIAHLREKLEDDAGRPGFVLTESGVGYRAVQSGDGQ